MLGGIRLKKIIKNLSGVILVLAAGIIWIYYNQNTNAESMYTTSNLVSRSKN